MMRQYQQLHPQFGLLKPAVNGGLGAIEEQVGAREAN